MAFGSNRVAAIDIEDHKLELVKSMGADDTLDCRMENIEDFVMKMSNGVGMDHICSNCSTSVVNSLFSMIHKGGHLCLVGFVKQPLYVENPPQYFLSINYEDSSWSLNFN